jgi:hypothetical protein
VAPDGDFFDLGGHSLLMTQLASRLREAFRVELSLRDVFTHPTVSGLAEVIDGQRRRREELETPPIVPVAHDGELPLSHTQQRLWFLQQLDPRDPAFNLSGGLRLRGALSRAALEASLGEIARRHQVLRATFHEVASEPRQRIAPAARRPLPVVDLGALPAAEREREGPRLVRAMARTPIDLTTGPVFRPGLIRLDDHHHLLFLTVHHVVCDGWSSALLGRELLSLYRAFSEGLPSPLPEPEVQYGDFAVWQRSWLRGEVLERLLDAWRRRLDGAPKAIALPADRPRPEVRGTRGARERLSLPESRIRELRRLGREAGATLFMTLLAAYGALFHHASGETDLVIGSNVAGRNRPEVEGLIGFFVNMLALRLDLSGDPTFRELIGRVREVALDAFVHQDLPFDRVVEEVRPERDPSLTPLVQVVFNFNQLGGLGEGPGLDAWPGIEVEPLRTGSTPAHFDLILDVAEVDDGLLCSLVYATELFDATTVRDFLDRYDRLLAVVAEDPDRRLGELREEVEAAERRARADRRREFRSARRRGLRSFKPKPVTAE